MSRIFQHDFTLPPYFGSVMMPCAKPACKREKGFGSLRKLSNREKAISALAILIQFIIIN